MTCNICRFANISRCMKRLREEHGLDLLAFIATYEEESLQPRAEETHIALL